MKSGDLYVVSERVMGGIRGMSTVNDYRWPHFIEKSIDFSRIWKVLENRRGP